MLLSSLMMLSILDVVLKVACWFLDRCRALVWFPNPLELFHIILSTLDEMRMSEHLVIQFCHRWLWLVSRVAPCQISDWKLAHLPKGAQGYIHNPFYSAQWTDSMSAKQSTRRFYSTQSSKLTLRLEDSWKTPMSRFTTGRPKKVPGRSFLVLVPWALLATLCSFGRFGHFGHFGHFWALWVVLALFCGNFW